MHMPQTLSTGTEHIRPSLWTQKKAPNTALHPGIPTEDATLKLFGHVEVLQGALDKGLCTATHRTRSGPPKGRTADATSRRDTKGLRCFRSKGLRVLRRFGGLGVNQWHGPQSTTITADVPMGPMGHSLIAPMSGGSSPTDGGFAAARSSKEAV